MRKYKALLMVKHYQILVVLRMYKTLERLYPVERM